MSSFRPILLRAFVVLGLLLSLAAPFQRASAAQLSAGGFTTSGRVSSASVPRGTTATVTVGVTASTGRAALVDVEVYDAAGRKVVQRFWDSQQFSAGVARSFSLTWAVPVDQGIGTYRVDVGVFGVGWNGLHQWNSGATSLQVTTGTPPAPTTTTTTTTTVPAPTTTVRPPTPTTTTTVPAPTTTVRPPTSTVAPPVTVPPSGALFAEDFAGNGFYTRFDHGWSGEVQAGTGFGANINDWPGDHDGMCANPNQPGRTIHVTAGADEHGAPAGSVRDVSQAFYNCLPGGDPAKGHLMTSVNTQGYVIAWFSPKQTFTNTRQVCWDQDHAFLGNGTWTQVVFLTATEAGTNPDLGFTSPEFPNNGGVSTPRGSARNGIKINMADFNNQFRMVGVQSWQNGGGYNDFNDWSRLDAPTTDKAPRYTICVTDNENGTLTIDRETVAGGVDGPRQSYTAAGSIPNTPIRVVFEHDNYNVDKHHSNAGEVATNQGEGYTRHWDNIRIS